jgi:hypothetical protein
VAIDYGYEDEFTNIPETSQQFGQKLLLMKVPSSIEAYHEDYNNKVRERVGTRMIPYIAYHLAFAP